MNIVTRRTTAPTTTARSPRPPVAQAAEEIASTGNAIVDAINSRPFSALLGPSFSALGRYWGEVTEDAVEGWRRRRIENATAHVQRVINVQGVPDSEEPTERQAKLVVEWGTTAEEVGPEQAELAAMWQGLLGAIIDNAPEAEDMQVILKSFSRRDASAFLSLRPTGTYVALPSGSRETMKKFLGKGLVVRHNFELEPTLLTKMQLAFMAVGIALIVFSNLTTDVLTFVNAVPQVDVKRLSLAASAVGWGALAYGGFSAFVPLLARWGKYRLTTIGHQLLVTGLRYSSRATERTLPANENSAD